MTYPGYMALSNEDGETIELINAARVKAYTDNLAPTMGLRGCEDCDGLEAATGSPEGYTTPAGDNAPWYDPTDPATGDFYGVYPLGFAGIDDSTRTIESAELSGDGSVVVGSRNTGKDIRVNGVAFAKDEAALYSGMSWLNSALNGTEEGRCFGDRLNVFSSCPPVQVLPPDFSEPYVMDLGTPARTNLFTNPSFETNGAWTSIGPDITLVQTQFMPLAGTDDLRMTIDSTPMSEFNGVGTEIGPLTPGKWVAVNIPVRPGGGVPVEAARIRIVWLDSGGTPIFSNTLSRVTLIPFEYNSLTFSSQAPAGTTSALVNLYLASTASDVPLADSQGHTDAWIGVMADTQAEALSGVATYFDGNTPDDGGFVYGWTGDPNASSSVEVPADEVSQEALNWTTTSGTIQGTVEGIRFDWNPGDPQKVACREITGLIPGEQYQLRMRLENFGDYYIRIADTCSSQRINMAPNPRLLGWAFGGGGVLDTESDVSTGGPLGLGWRRSILTSSNTGSPYSMVTPVEDQIPVTAGDLLQISIYVRGDTSVARLAADWYTEAGTVVMTDQRLIANVSMTGEWIRLSGIVTVPQNAAFLRPAVRWSATTGALQPNMIFGAANLLVEEPRYDILRINRHRDPRAQSATDWPFFGGTGGVATSTSITGAADGPVLYESVQSPTYRRHEVTTAPTGGSAGPLSRNLSTQGTYPFVLPAGTPWVTGAYFRSNRAISGTVIHQLFDSDGASVGLESYPFNMAANTWTYFAGGGTEATDVTNIEDSFVWLVVGGEGGGAAMQVGDIYESTGGMLQFGSAQEDYYDSQRPANGLIGYTEITSSNGSGAAEVMADEPGTYFDGNTEGFRWDGAANSSASSVDQGIDYETVSGWSQKPPNEPDVLDFIPRTDSVFLSITPTQTVASGDTQALLVEEALVRRTPRPGVLAFGSGHDVVPPSDGWTHLTPDGMRVEWVHGAAVEYHMVWSIGTAPSGSALTYTPQHGIERTVFGMIPGNRYRFMVSFESVWFETDVSPGQDVNPFVSLGTGTGAVATYTVDNGSTHFWVIEFTATETSTIIGLHPNADLALGSFGSVWWQIDQYLVEEILETDATEPDPGRFQARTMYEVKASQGPILSNLRRAACGVMAEVTYSLRAGNPFKYRNPIFAGGLPAGTSVTVPDTSCSDDRLPQIVNFAYNPSLEANGLDWAAGGVNVTSERSNLFGGRVGDYAFQASAVPGNGRVHNIVAYYVVFNVVDGPVPIPGEEITVSAWVRTLEPEYTGTYTWLVYVGMFGFPSFSFEGTVDIDVAETWYRFEHTFTLPSNVPLEHIETHIQAPDSITTGGNLQMDALMIQRGDTATEPFDETTPGAEWAGVPNASAVLLTQSAPDLSEDPDCPTPPAPPAPPAVDDVCVTEPTSYNRTVVSISADTVPRNLTAYPIITLTAGSEPVRQARIRFWENPDALTIDDLGQCDYDGEIIVSFLASGATLVINGALRDATVSKPGVEGQNANHTLYGPEGGPVEWPELTGGIPYLVTLELDSEETYTDTLMLVDLVVRD